MVDEAPWRQQREFLLLGDEAVLGSGVSIGLLFLSKSFLKLFHAHCLNILF